MKKSSPSRLKIFKKVLYVRGIERLLMYRFFIETTRHAKDWSRPPLDNLSKKLGALLELPKDNFLGKVYISPMLLLYRYWVKKQSAQYQESLHADYAERRALEDLTITIFETLAELEPSRIKATQSIYRMIHALYPLYALFEQTQPLGVELQVYKDFFADHDDQATRRELARKLLDDHGLLAKVKSGPLSRPTGIKLVNYGLKDNVKDRGGYTGPGA